ncbi:uncharacterized protein LOC135121402 [Zophobas morio]|uniref:uncharacterized protein LOC135121402 n=1 Tax=Zophobas morio TaxID=2755281 RepID=UPI0030829271
MGLNLQIQRLLFASLTKFDGFFTRNLTPTETRQLAGRAGRFMSKYETGFTSVLHKKDYSALKNNLSSAFEEVTRMAIMPTSGLIEKFLYQVGVNKLSGLLAAFNTMKPGHSSLYYMADLTPIIHLAKLCESLDISRKLNFATLWGLCLAPINPSIVELVDMLRTTMKNLANKQPIYSGDVIYYVPNHGSVFDFNRLESLELDS